MPDWPSLGGDNRYEWGGDAANSRGVSLTAPGAINTKGAWTQIIAATAFCATAINIHIGEGQANPDQLIDIGIGGAGSEIVLISNMVKGTGTGNIGKGALYQFPLLIPQGVRISARYQTTSITSPNCRVSVRLMGQGFFSPSPLEVVTTYGADTTDSGGTSIDPGATANTKGAWTVLSASTGQPMRALVFAAGNQGNTTRTSCNWLVDVGMGGAGVEQVIVPNYWLEASSTDDTVTPQASPLFPVNIPSASRLVVRAQCSINTATVRLFDAVIYGVS